MTKPFSLPIPPKSDHLASIRPARLDTGLCTAEIVSTASLRSIPATRFLTNAEAAAFLKLSPRTLEKQRVLGGGPKYRKLGRRVVYAVDDLQSWADARICTSTSDASPPTRC